MLQDMILPPEQLSNLQEEITFTSSNLGSQILDFGEEGLFSTENLRNSEVVSSSGYSEETHCSTSTTTTDPTLLRYFGYDAQNPNEHLSILLPENTDTSSSSHFPTIFQPAGTFLPNQNQNQDQLDLSSLEAQIPLEGGFMPYSPEEITGGDTAMRNVFTRNNGHNSNTSQSLVPLNFDGSVFCSPLDADEDCLSPMGSYVHRPCLSSSFLERSLSGNAFAQFSPGIMNPAMAAEAGSSFPIDITNIPAVPCTNTGLLSQELEFQGEQSSGVYVSESVRRTYSAGDIQVSNENPMVNGCVSPLASSDMSNFEETGFKVGRYSVEERKERIHRYMKKRNERNFNKKIKYACRKTLADSRPRVRGRFAKNDEFGDAGTRSSYGNHDEEDDNVTGEKEQDEMMDSSDIFAHISGVNSFKSNYHLQSWI